MPLQEILRRRQGGFQPALLTPALVPPPPPDPPESRISPAEPPGVAALMDEAPEFPEGPEQASGLPIIPEVPFLSRAAPAAQREPLALGEEPAESRTGLEEGPAEETADGDWNQEITDVVYRTPAWIIRSGSTLMTGIVCLLLGLAWMIKFPDVVKGRAEIVGVQPAVPVVARTAGHITLQVSEGARVESGAMVGVIANPADTHAVLNLKQRLLELLQTNLVDTKPPAMMIPAKDGPDAATLDLEGVTRLGELQHVYSEFFYLYKRLRQLTTDAYPARALEGLHQEQKRNAEVIASIESQQSSLSEEIALSKDAVARNERLERQGAIALARVQALQQDLLAKQRQHQSLSAQRKVSEIDAQTIAKKILDFNHEHQDEIVQTHAKVREALKQTLGAIEVWEEKYVLRAPVSGRISIFEFWSDAQYVEANREVFVVVPESQRIMGRVKVEGAGAGRIKPGQRVILHLADYPSDEFGVVNARVSSLSGIAREGHYMVIAEVPFPLVTNFDKTLVFRNHMAGEGRIVTEDLSLLQRMFHSLRYLVVDQIAGE